MILTFYNSYLQENSYAMVARKLCALHYIWFDIIKNKHQVESGGNKPVFIFSSFKYFARNVRSLVTDTRKK